jgi:hypothetical protein
MSNPAPDPYAPIVALVGRLAHLQGTCLADRVIRLRYRRRKATVPDERQNTCDKQSGQQGPGLLPFPTDNAA